MSHFSIRVLLHDAEWSHYVDLAQRLAAMRIIDVITADNGRQYKLPPAEYCYTGDQNLSEVLTAAKGAADQTGRKNAVVVTQGSSTWAGLAPA